MLNKTKIKKHQRDAVYNFRKILIKTLKEDYEVEQNKNTKDYIDGLIKELNKFELKLLEV